MAVVLNANAQTPAAGPVVVTGADGFIGSAFCAYLAKEARPYRRVVRAHREHGGTGETCVIADLATAAGSALAAALENASVVVHLAARAHVLEEAAADAEAAFHAANVVATERLAQAAIAAGVQCIVFASTVKVNGETSQPGHPFRAADLPAPADAYARSKANAERVLFDVCKGSSVVPIVLRLPLVYGPGVKANFLALMDAVARRTPLPFAMLHNRRNLLFVGNLAHAILRLVDSVPPLAGAWMIADDEALSMGELTRRIGVALDIEPRMFPVPPALIRIGALLMGRSSLIPRLTGSLQVDSAPLVQTIGALPYAVDQGLAQTAAWWRARHAI